MQKILLITIIMKKLLVKVCSQRKKYSCSNCFVKIAEATLFLSILSQIKFIGMVAQWVALSRSPVRALTEPGVLSVWILHVLPASAWVSLTIQKNLEYR